MRRMSQRGTCVRRVGYSELGYEPAPSLPRQDVVRRMGEVIERALIPHLKERGVVITHSVDDDGQMEITNSIGELGHPDGIIEAARRKVLEVKGTNPVQWNMVRRNGVLAEAIDYVHQADGYMEELNIPEEDMYWVNRATGDYFVTAVTLDKKRWAARNEINDAAWELINQGILPEPEYDGSDYHCYATYCPFSHICPSGEVSRAKAALVEEAKTLGEVDVEVLERAAEQWLAAQAEAEGSKAAIEESKEVFMLAMRKAGVEHISVGGVDAIIKRRRPSVTYDAKVLENTIPLEMLKPAQKVSGGSEWPELRRSA